MSFPEILRTLRKSKNLSRQELADATGISIHSISSYEKGRREPNSKALTALENYFQVSGAYLRGEIDGCTQATARESIEITETARDRMPDQLAKLNAILRESGTQEKKNTFDILVELGHILKLENPAQRAAGMTLIQAVFAATTRYIDVCTSATKDIDPITRPQQAKDTAMQSYDQALQNAFFSPK